MGKSTVIGSLKVSLLAVTKGYTKGLGRASKNTKRFTRLLRTNLRTALGLALGKLTAFGLKGLGSIPRLVGRAVAGLAKLVKMLAITLVAAAGAATVALGLLAKNSAALIVKAKLVADKLGIAISKMAGMTLAAKDAGLEFNQFTLGLQRMTRRVAEAAKGTGEAQGALEELNLDAKELAKLSPDKQFLKIADALAEVVGQSDKIRLGFKLFDSEGVQNILVTADAIRRASKEARILGLELSDIDAASVQNAGLAVDRLKLAFQGVGNQLAIQLAPIIGGVAARVLRLIESLGGIETIVAGVVASVKPKILAFADSFAQAGVFISTRMSEAMTSAAESMDGLGDHAVTTSGVIRAAFNTSTSVAKLAFLGLKAFVLGIFATIVFEVDQLRLAIIDTLNFLSKAFASMGELVGFHGTDFGQIGSDAKSQLTIIADSLIAQAAEAGKEFGEAFNSSLDSAMPTDSTALDQFLQRTGDGIADLAARSAESFANLTNSIEAGIAESPASDRLTEFITNLRREFDGLNGSIDVPNLEDFETGLADVADEAEKTGTVLDKIKSNFTSLGDGIVSNLKRGETAFEQLRNVALSVADSIAGAFLQKGIDSVIGSVFGGGGGLFGGLFGGAQAALQSPAIAAVPGGGGETFVIQLIGDNTGDKAIEEAVARGINKARPGLKAEATAHVQKRMGRDPSFAFSGA